MNKVCTKCLKELDLRLFSPSSTLKSGYRNECKNCRASMMQARRKKENYVPDLNIVEKLCYNCKEIASIINFYKDCKAKDGFQNKCKKCHYIVSKK